MWASAENAAKVRALLDDICRSRSELNPTEAQFETSRLPHVLLVTNATPPARSIPTRRGARASPWSQRLERWFPRSRIRSGKDRRVEKLTASARGSQAPRVCARLSRRGQRETSPRGEARAGPGGGTCVSLFSQRKGPEFPPGPSGTWEGVPATAAQGRRGRRCSRTSWSRRTRRRSPRTRRTSKPRFRGHRSLRAPTRRRS